MQLNWFYRKRRTICTTIMGLILQAGFTQLIYINAGRDIFSFDPITCEYTFVVKTSHGFLDLAFDRNGILYGCGTDLERVNTVTGGLTKLVELNTAVNGMTISADDIVYMGASDGELISYNLLTNITTFLGNMGYGCAGDLTFYKGELYMAAFNNQFVKVDIEHPGQSILLFTHQSQSDIVGIISEFVNCDETKVYALSGDHTEIYLIDFVDLTLDLVCQLPIDVYGGASTSEFLASVPVTLGDPAIVQINCNSSDGSISFPEASGFGVLLFRLNKGIWQSESIFNLLNPGTYTIELMDEHGCLDSTKVTILNADNFILQNIKITPTPCGYSEGEFSFSASGGIGALSFSLTGVAYQSEMFFTSLPSGNFSLYIKDETGCIITREFEIPELGFDTNLDYDVIKPSCNKANGSLNLYHLQEDDFEFALDGGFFQSDSVFYDLKAGSHTLLIRNSNQCLDTVIILVEASLGPVMQLVSISPASCSLSNGRIEVFVQGGNPPFSYSIDNSAPQTEQVFEMLSSGEHFIYLVDIQGCLDSMETEIPMISGPVIQFIESKPSSCIGNTGEIHISWVSTLGSDFLQVYDQMEHPVGDLDKLAPGEYHLVLNDASGCLVDTVILVKAFECSMSIPNIFSPNGDGINDEFVISKYPADPSVMIHCEIFDRWGDQVYLSASDTNASDEFRWDGKNLGKDCSPGVYVYILRKSSSDGKVKSTFGNVTLIR